MEAIRRATMGDASRLAEILIFAKRVHYRSIFNDDRVSFGEMQVLPLARAFVANPEALDPFFQGQGIGKSLMDFAIRELDVRYLFVLEKNHKAIRFYQNNGFPLTQERQVEPGTPEFIVRMEREIPVR